MKRHLITHNNENEIFRCEKCNFVSFNKKSFEAHRLKYINYQVCNKKQSKISLDLEDANFSDEEISNPLAHSIQILGNGELNYISESLEGEELLDDLIDNEEEEEDTNLPSELKDSLKCELCNFETSVHTYFKAHVKNHDVENANTFPDSENGENKVKESEEQANSEGEKFSFQNSLADSNLKIIPRDFSNDEISDFCSLCSTKDADEDVAENVLKNCNCHSNNRKEVTNDHSGKVLRVRLYDVKHVGNKMYEDVVNRMKCSSEKSASEDEQSSNVNSSDSANVSLSFTFQNEENTVDEDCSYKNLSKMAESSIVCSNGDENEKSSKEIIPSDKLSDIEKSPLNLNNGKSENCLKDGKTTDMFNIFDDKENADFCGFDESNPNDASVKGTTNAKGHKRSLIFSIKNSRNCDRNSKKFYYCSKCSYRSPHKQNVKIHLKRRHSIDFFYKCKVCKCIKNTYKELKIHKIEYNHLGSENVNTDSLPHDQVIIEVDCETQKSTEIDNYLVSKNLSSSKKKINNCKSSVKSSSKTVTNFIYCSECSYKSRYVTNVKVHMKRLHALENFYQCQKCKCRKSTRKELKKHEAECSSLTLVNKTTDFHLSRDKIPKEAKCLKRKSITILKSTKKGKKLKSKERNEMSQISSNKELEDDKNEDSPLSDDENRKKFRCSFCSYSSDYLFMTKQHVLTHTDLRLYKCKYCDFKSNIKKSIRNHYLRYHISSIINNSSQEDQADVEGILSGLCKVDKGAFNISSLYISISKSKERECYIKSPTTNGETPYKGQQDFSESSSSLSGKNETSHSRKTNIPSISPSKKRKAKVNLKSRKKFKNNNNMDSQIIEQNLDNNIVEYKNSDPIKMKSDIVQRLELPKMTIPDDQDMGKNTKNTVLNHSSIIKKPGVRSERVKRKKAFNEYSRNNLSSECMQKLKSPKMSDDSSKLRNSGTENSIAKSGYGNYDKDIKEIDSKIKCEESKKKNSSRESSYCYMLSKYLEDLEPYEYIKCENCEFTAKSASVLRRHMCESKFNNEQSSPSNINNEQSSSSNSKQNLEFIEKKKCEHCEFTTISKGWLTRHKCKSKPINEFGQNKLSQKNEEKQDKDEMDNKNIDNAKSNNFNSNSLNTVRVLEPRITFKCFGCDFIGPSVSHLKTHNCKVEKNSEYIDDNSSKPVHKLDSKSVFKCNYCEFETTIKNVLKRHTCKSKACDEQLCNTDSDKNVKNLKIEKFIKSDDLELNEDSKNTIKRYKCRAKPFKCKYCDYATNKIILLMEHSGTVHSDSEFLHFSGKISFGSRENDKTKLASKIEKISDKKLEKDLIVEENSDTFCTVVTPQKAKTIVKREVNQSSNGIGLSDESVPQTPNNNEISDNRDNECDSQSQDANSKLLRCPFCLYNSPIALYLKRHLQRMHIKPVISRKKKIENLSPKKNDGSKKKLQKKCEKAPMLNCMHCSFKTTLLFNYKHHIEMHIKRQRKIKEKNLKKTVSESAPKKGRVITKVNRSRKLDGKQGNSVRSNIIKRNNNRKSNENNNNISSLCEPKEMCQNIKTKVTLHSQEKIFHSVQSDDKISFENNSNISSLDKELFNCTNCDFKSYFRKSMTRHMKTHSSSESSLFKCLRCKFSTGNSVTFKKHQLNCNGPLTPKVTTEKECHVKESEKKSESSSSSKDKINDSKKSGSSSTKKISSFINKSNVNRTKMSSKNRSNFLSSKSKSKTKKPENKSEFSGSKNTSHASASKNAPSKKKKKSNSEIKGRPPKVDIYEILKTNPQVRIFDCLTCNYKTIYRNALWYHITSQRHRGNLYHCILCNFKTFNKCKLIRHKTMSHKSTEKLLKCPSCDFVTSWKGALTTHNRHFHP